jgi:glycosyltransferase involved in cell wall biosynthesis
MLESDGEIYCEPTHCEAHHIGLWGKSKVSVAHGAATANLDNGIAACRALPNKPFSPRASATRGCLDHRRRRTEDTEISCQCIANSSLLRHASVAAEVRSSTGSSPICARTPRKAREMTDSSWSRNIALISGNLALGGATTFVLNLASEINRAGGQALVLNLEGTVPNEFSDAGISTMSPPVGTRWFEEKIAWALAQLSRFQPHSVIANLPISFEPLRYAPAGVKRIGVAHQSDPEGCLVIEPYAPWLDCVAAVSQQIQKQLEARQVFAPGCVKLAHLGVPIPPVDWVRTPNVNRPLRILYLGRLCREHKRADLLPQIHAGVTDRNISATWTIAGDGPIREQLEQELVPRGVRFTGKLGHDAVQDLLRQQDVLLLPSDYEGLPLSVLEAMACEVVPVASDLPSGLREVIDDTTGVLVPPSEIDKYARELVALDQDRPRLVSLGQAARNRVSTEFSTGAMFQRWKPLLEGEANSAWPLRFDIKPPRGAERSFRFWPPLRWIARRAHAFRQRLRRS